MNHQVKISALETIRYPDFCSNVELKKSLRRADDFTKLAVNCVLRAVNSLPEELFDNKDQIGIFLGTAFGPIETSFRFLDTLLDDGEGNASPTLFSHSVHNAANGYISRILNISGPAITLTSFTWPFISALKQAQVAVAANSIKQAIVLGVETSSPALACSFRKFHPHYDQDDNSGATVWILERCSKNKKQSIGLALDEVEIIEEPCSASDLIKRTGENWTGRSSQNGKSTGILSYAFSLTDQLKKVLEKNQKEKITWISDASFGQVRMLFSNTL